MSIRVGMLLVAVLALAACGGDRDGPGQTPTPATPEPTATATPNAGTPFPAPDELRVAYINLMSPIAVDETNPAPAETFEERLDIVIEELQVFRPHIVGFSEATWQADLGASAMARLARGLGMEGGPYARANPWFSGQTEEESDTITQEIGFEEGEMLLVRSPLSIRSWERAGLNPRTSESEGRAALHVVVRGPEPMDEIDVYVTRFSGNETTRAAQARDFLTFVELTRGEGPVIVMGDFGAGPSADYVQRFVARGYTGTLPSPTPTPRPDAADDGQGSAEPTPESPSPFATCCRPAVLAEEPLVEPDTQTDYIFSDEWVPASAGLFAHEPRPVTEAFLYASDHNGLYVTYALGTASPEDAGPSPPVDDY